MKKIIFLILLFFVSFVSFGQVYQAMPQYGYGPVKRMDFDSSLTIPTTCGVPTLKTILTKKAAIAFDSCNNRFYQYNPKTSTWSTIGGGDTFNLQQVTDAGDSTTNDIYVYYADNPNARTLINNNFISISTPDEYDNNDAIYSVLTPNDLTLINRSPFEVNNDSSYLNLSYNKILFNDINNNSYLTLKPIYQSNKKDSFYLPIPKNTTDTLATLADVRNNAPATPNLQQVTDIGNTTTNEIILTSGSILTHYKHASIYRENTATGDDFSIVFPILNNQNYVFPSQGGYIPVSVNGNFADAAGNINISTQNGRFGNDTATIVMAKVHNDAGVTLTNGKVVAFSTSGTSSDAPSVKLANNKADSTSATTFGFVSGTIAVNDTGWVILSGKIEKLNTSAFANGDIIYLDSTSGNWTKTKPVAPYHMVYLGVVVKANAGNGAIFVKCQNGYELDEIHDVQISNKLNNQVLAYSDTQKVWKNRNIYSIVDTSTIVATKSNVALKLNISDTATMLSPYLRSNTASATYLAKSDSTIYYTKYRSDTSRTNIYNAINGKVNISDTASMLNPYLRKADTVSLSNRINLKLNISDTASMLNPYLRKIDTTNKFVNTITRTAGKDSIIFYIGSTRYAIKDSTGGGGTTYTFSTGLTNSSGTITNNLSTGISGGQSVIGGTAASNSLTLSSTSNATKGKILFGTSAYDEVNNRLGIGTATPTHPFHLTGSTTASSAIARGAFLNNTLVAAANNDTLIGLDINPNFNNGSFTNVSNIALRIPNAFTFGINSSGTAEIKGISSNGAVDFLGPASNAGSFNFYGGSAYNTGGGVSVTGNGNLYPSQIQFFRNGFVKNGYFSTAGNLILSTGNTDAGYKLDVNGTARVQGALNFNPTNTAAGTTGNQTINKPSGTVNIAAAGTTVTVTNSLVTASSIVFAVIRTNDATATIKNVVPGAGSFTINLNAAATAETSIGFFVIN